MRVCDLPRYGQLTLVHELELVARLHCEADHAALDRCGCFYVEQHGTRLLRIYGVEGDTPYCHTPVIQLF